MAYMKVDVVELINTLDPFTRTAKGDAVAPKAEGMTPKFAAILEFVLSITNKTVGPVISSIATTSDGHIIANGDYLGTVVDLEENLIGWVRAHKLSRIEEEAFQKMLDDTIGYSAHAVRVTL